MCCTKETKLLVYNSNTNSTSVCMIGDLVEEIFDDNENNTIEYGKNSYGVKVDHISIVSVDPDTEKVAWKPLSEVSKHPPNGKLVRVTTRSGRVITTTLTHAHLKRSDSHRIEPTLAKDLKIGDRVPVAYSICQPPKIITELNISDFRTVKLDSDFGWFIGAYLAEGSMNGNSIVITNISNVFKENTKKIADRFDYQFRHETYIGEYGPGANSIIVKCKPLKQHIVENCGRFSFTKKVPDYAFNSSDEFVSGVIRGYFEGDGNVAGTRNMIRAHSRSEQLLADISLLLARFGIFARHISYPKGGSILYEIDIPGKYAQLFKEKIGLTIKHKCDALDDIISYNKRADQHSVCEAVDKIPNVAKTLVEISDVLEIPNRSRNYHRWLKKESIGRRTLIKFMNDIQTHLDKKEDSLDSTKKENIINKFNKLKQAAYSDIIWDQIVKLEIVDTPDMFVYDLTVPGNHTFMTHSGILIHNTLNTFHFAGISAKSNVTRGVPRMQELLSASKNMKLPFLIIKLKEEDQLLQYRAKEIAHNIEFTPFEHFIKEYEIFYEPNPSKPVLQEDQTLVSEYIKNTIGFKFPNNISRFVMRFVLNRNQMIYKQMRMNLIQAKINNYENGSMFAIVSDDNAEKLIVRVHLDLDKVSGKSKKSELQLIDKYKKILLDQFQLRGTPHITSANIRLKKTAKFNRETGEMKDIDEWYIDTDGTNLIDVLGHPMIDFTQTVSNDVNEVLETLGIEAARATLFKEFNDTFEFSGASINYHHIALLSDLMTHSGRLMSINRFGINRVDDGPISRITFEESIDQLKNAAQYNEIDNMKGSSANIMFGQVGRYGTGYTDIVFDTSAFGVESDDIMNIINNVGNTAPKKLPK
jgi:intein/homing endonuclease